MPPSVDIYPADKWSIPQVDTDKKIGPKISQGLAVNVAMTVKSDKSSIDKIPEKYQRQENTPFLCATNCNKDVWDPIRSYGHGKDLINILCKRVNSYCANC